MMEGFDETQVSHPNKTGASAPKKIMSKRTNKLPAIRYKQDKQTRHKPNTKQFD